jgi:hypothetical protein
VIKRLTLGDCRIANGVSAQNAAGPSQAMLSLIGIILMLSLPQ